MPISLPASLKYVVAPVHLNADLSADVTLVGYVELPDATRVDITRFDEHIPVEDVAAILSQAPEPGYNRLDDLTIAIYRYLVSKGKAPAGNIS